MRVVVGKSFFKVTKLFCICLLWWLYDCICQNSWNYAPKGVNIITYKFKNIYSFFKEKGIPKYCLLIEAPGKKKKKNTFQFMFQPRPEHLFCLPSCIGSTRLLLGVLVAHCLNLNLSICHSRLKFSMLSKERVETIHFCTNGPKQYSAHGIWLTIAWHAVVHEISKSWTWLNYEQQQIYLTGELFS